MRGSWQFFSIQSLETDSNDGLIHVLTVAGEKTLIEWQGPITAEKLQVTVKRLLNEQSLTVRNVILNIVIPAIRKTPFVTQHNLRFIGVPFEKDSLAFYFFGVRIHFTSGSYCTYFEEKNDGFISLKYHKYHITCYCVCRVCCVRVSYRDRC